MRGTDRADRARGSSACPRIPSVFLDELVAFLVGSEGHLPARIVVSTGVTKRKPAPLGPLRYLYFGTDALEEDIALWTDRLGCTEIWRFQRFGADVAGFRTPGEGPMVLLADHMERGEVLPIYVVEDLARTRRALRGVPAERVETPDGPCLVLTCPGGARLGLLDEVRPDALLD